ncbi:DNA-binding protein Ewg, partial [Blattella germanica]
IHTAQGADGTPTVHAVQALAEVATAQSDGLAVDLNNVTEATLNQDGQIILTGEDGHASMYQTVVANLQQIHTQGDGTIQVVTPMVQVPKVEPTNGSETVDTITVTPQLMGATHQVVAMGNEPQVLQVLSLKDAVLAKPVVTSSGEVKEEVATASADQ